MAVSDSLATLAICAVRYALGRRSYIAHDVAMAVSGLDLDHGQRAVIIRNIDGADREGRLGDECDAARWRELRDTLRRRGDGG